LPSGTVSCGLWARWTYLWLCETAGTPKGGQSGPDGHPPKGGCCPSGLSTMARKPGWTGCVSGRSRISLYGCYGGMTYSSRVRAQALPRSLDMIGLRLRDSAAVCGRCHGFGPALPAEGLAGRHGCAVSRETLRGWMTADGLWRDRRRRLPAPAAATARLPGRAGADRRLRARLPRAWTMHRPAHGAALRGEQDGVLLPRGDARPHRGAHQAHQDVPDRPFLDHANRHGRR
jgi:hypothetical protein